MLRRAAAENPGCDGIVLGGHGLFTWGDTQRECYLNTLTIIDQLGQFVAEHVEKKAAAFSMARNTKCCRTSRERPSIFSPSSAAVYLPASA